MPLPGNRVTLASVAADLAVLARGWLPTIVVAATSAAAGVWWSAHRNGPAVDATAEAAKAAGRAYPRALGSAYAEAWRKGAEALDAGKGVAEAVGVVGESWKAGRTDLFDRAVAPSFAAVVPEGKPDAEVARADKAALAALWRAFADGLAAPN